MRLLQEYIEPSSVDCITESTADGKKHLYIKGVFAEAELKNRNNRIYPKSIMENSIKKYVDNYVSKNRALGELSHPEGRVSIAPERASHLITDLRMEGNTVYGKAKILNTPQGQIARGLLEGGVQLGVSTRGLGSVHKLDDTIYVKEDYLILGVDIVNDPSSINAWVDAVNENQEWVVTDDGRIVEATKKKLKKINKLSESKQLELFSDFMMQISKRKFKN